jgi:hypothetical protein
MAKNWRLFLLLPPQKENLHNISNDPTSPKRLIERKSHQERMNKITANTRAAPDLKVPPQHRQRVTNMVNTWPMSRKMKAAMASPVDISAV